MLENIPHVSERIEAATLNALHAQASDAVRDRLGLRLERIGGTMVSIAARDPSILLNRTLGFGLTRPATVEEIERIQAIYEDHGVDRYYVGVHPDASPAHIEQYLTNAGFESARGWVKFERGGDAAQPAQSTLDVRQIGTDHVEDFGRIAASGFGLTPEAASLFRGLIDHPKVRMYMTFDGDTHAGTGMMYIDGEHAWLDWASTDPAFRRQGSQRAVLARRIKDAVDATCTRLMTATGEAVPDDPQHSYHNIEWAGFEPVCTRENWIPKSAQRS